MYSSVWNVRGLPNFILSCTPCHQFATHERSHQPTIMTINPIHNQITNVVRSKRRSRITLVFFGSGRLAVSLRRGLLYRTALVGVFSILHASGLSSSAIGLRVGWRYRASSVCLGAFVRNGIGEPVVPFHCVPMPYFLSPLMSSRKSAACLNVISPARMFPKSFRTCCCCQWHLQF